MPTDAEPRPGGRGDAALVGELVISVHRAVADRHGEEVRSMLDRWALPAPGIVIDLAEFWLAGSLTAEVASARFAFWDEAVVREGLESARAVDSIDADLGRLLRARADTARSMWAHLAVAVDVAVAGATAALDAASRPLAVAYRALPLPTDPPHRLHHLLTGLRYERLGAHVEACVGAGLDRRAAVALTGAWSGAGVDRAQARLVSRGLVDVGGRITPRGRELRDEIEAVTESACASMAAVVGDGWRAALEQIAAT